MWIRELINERKWRHGDLAALEIAVRHRGVPGDLRTISGAEVKEVGANGLFLSVDPEIYGDDEELLQDGSVFVPWHRVMRVTAASGVLWARREEDP